MSNEELVALIQKGINASKNLGILYEKNKGYIYKIANRYRGHTEVEDLMQEGYFGLYEAAQRYENEHEVLFMTYAGYWIRQSIQRYIENNSSSLRLPVHLRSLIYKHKKVINAYEVQLGRKPTNEELCYYLKISLKQLESLEKNIYEYGRIGSLDEPLSSSEDGDLLVGHLVPDSVDIENQVINNMHEESLKTELWVIVKDNTTEEENKVIQDRFINNLSLKATGENQGKTIEMARQLEAKAIRKLRRPRITRQLRERYEIGLALAYKGSVSSFNHSWESSTERAAFKLMGD